jgi:DNA-binding transcriptional ArsR family regulator
LGLTQQNVSKHLQILHRNGLVTRRPEGSSVINALRDSSTVRLLDDVVTGVSDHLRELSELATVRRTISLARRLIHLKGLPTWTCDESQEVGILQMR